MYKLLDSEDLTHIVILHIKPNVKRKTMALAWIYLKTFGQMTKPLCDELFWAFKKEDFKHAVACFILDDGENCAENVETNILVKNIKIRFDKFISIPVNLAKRPRTRKRGAQSSANLLGFPKYEGTIADWAKEMYSKVNLPLIALFLILYY